MTQTKRPFASELCYLLGLLFMALGTALMEKAGFGMSMVVAPAYLVHLKLSQVIPFFTFGMAEYTLQAILILGLSLVMGRFRLGYLFSFVTAVLYGLVLDGWLLLLGGLPTVGMPVRLLWFILGMPLCALGVALFFHTYLSPEAYELIVMEVCRKWNIPTGRCKTVYDCCSCGVSILLSFLFFGPLHFVGIGLGTVVCALLNGRIIGFLSKILERRLEIRARCPELEKFFKY
jgi:uncharacterized membrane protein YczE